VVVIGDTPHDVDCARACGAVAVAVATGQYPREALLADRPDHFFEDLSDTDRVLRALLGDRA
jgi:phosphoglycolate phosphatase-like HAD superfamily hydrolase